MEVGMNKVNCWEFRNCGRQPGGENVEDLGLCAAATTSIMEGIHGGIKGGRACWIIVGTQCGLNGNETGDKHKRACVSCDFFNLVKVQEGMELQQSEGLLNLVR
jgi:hypothetical protein